MYQFIACYSTENRKWKCVLIKEVVNIVSEIEKKHNAKMENSLCFYLKRKMTHSDVQWFTCPINVSSVWSNWKSWQTAYTKVGVCSRTHTSITVQAHYRNLSRLHVIRGQFADANPNHASIEFTIFRVVWTYENMFSSAFTQCLASDFTLLKKIN